MTRALRKIVKWFYLLLAIALILLAVMVQSGRSFSHLVDDYNQPIAAYLSRSFNAQVKIGDIKAAWDGLKPSLDIRDLSISNQEQQPIAAFKQARLRLDILESLVNRRLVWSHLGIRQMSLEFVQTPEGLWQLAGLPKDRSAPADTKVQLDELLDMLLLSQRIEMKESHFRLKFATGEQLDLDAPSVLLENRNDFHRLSLQVDVGNQPRSVYLVMESQGDPRVAGEFHSAGYLQLNQFPTSEPIAAASAFLLGGTHKVGLKSQGIVDANIWFESRTQDDGFDLSGRIGLQRLALPMAKRQVALDGFETELTGYWLRSGSWRLALQNTQASLREQHISGINLAVGSAGFKQPLEMSMAELDVGRLLHLLDGAGTLGNDKLQEILLTLNPRGKLKNLHLHLPLTAPKEWQLRANGVQLEVDAWRGVPALTGVDGYIEAGQKGGFFNIDSQHNFSMHFSPTYAAPMAFERARGQVAWELLPELNQVYVNSGALEFTQGAEQLKGYMWLAIPWQRNSGDIDLYLDVGARQLSASLYQKYTPALIADSLSTWLARSIGTENSGMASSAGLVFRGTLNTKNHAMRSHQLYLDIKNAALDYQADWPPLSNISGRLLLDDNQVFSSIDTARIYTSQVSKAQLSVLPSSKGSLLKLKGRVAGPAADGLKVLQEGALQRILNDAMSSWRVTGVMDATLDLAVPLGGAKANLGYQRVAIDLTAEQFAMGNIDLSLQDLNGHLTYNSDSGLASEQLTANLFDQPISATIKSEKTPAENYASNTLIDIEGAVDIAPLATWSKRPELLFMQGLMPYRAQIALRHGFKSKAITAPIEPQLAQEPSQSGAADAGSGPSESATSLVSAKDFAGAAAVSVRVVTTLKNVAVDLPAPYGKTAKGKRRLALTLALQEQEAQVELSYGKQANSILRLQRSAGGFGEKSLLGVNIALATKAQLADEPSFLISGKLAEFDLAIWQEVLARYQGFGQTFSQAQPIELVESPEDANLVAGLPLKIDLNLARYDVGALRLVDLGVKAQRNASAWHLQLENQQLAGSLEVPYNSFSPLQLKLQRLALSSASLLAPAVSSTSDPVENNAPSLTEEVTPIQQLELIDPRKLPLANIDIASLSLDGDNFGSWSVQLRPNKKGVVFDNIRGSIRGVRISGIEDDLDGARLIWQHTDQGVKSRFIGSLSASDMGAVLRQWDKPDTIESHAARFKTDLYWLGSPQDFSLVNLNGDMSLWLEKGRFKRDATAGDGILRLMSILNFDSLARRMRLDFSDLYQSGLAYDEINGKVEFNQGVMVFAEPLVVRTPSSGMQMAGTIDLRRETIDTRLVATLPVAGNLTFFTALATGLPAAAGIYLVSKLFKKQVDQATSLTYAISGSWDNPTMRFDRLFESEKSLRDSVNKTEEEKAKEEAKKQARKLKRSNNKTGRTKPTAKQTEPTETTEPMTE